MLIKQQFNRLHWLSMVALFFCLTSFYMLTYSGRVMFNDELQMFDVTGSMVEQADEKYDLAMWYVWTNYGPIGQDRESLYPLTQSPVEPLQSLLGTPLYKLAQAVDGFGLVHTVWLVNVFVCAAIGVLFFQFCRLLKYPQITALLAALALCIGTVLWPYSRTFLREPLTTFLALLSAYALVRRWYVVAVLAFVAAFFTKESVLMLLPALLVFVVPSYNRGRQVLDLGLLLIIAAVFILIYTDIIEQLIPEPIFITDFYQLRTTFTREALHTFLLSVGGSIWGTSPIILLAIPGILLKWQRRYLWVAVLATVGLAFGHAITAGGAWSGGATWPPRFMIPVLPFWMILALPAIQYLTKATFWRIAALGLVMYSLWWQISAVSFSWLEYYDLLPPESNGLAEWGGGLNNLSYIRPVLLSSLWFNQELDFAWVRTNTLLWPVLYLCICVGGLAYLKFRSALYGLFPLIFVIVTVFSLISINDDPIYLGDRDSLHKIADLLDDEQQPDDILLLNSPQYHWFFLNEQSLDHIRIVTLPAAPGERGSFEEQPEVIFDKPEELLNENVPDFIASLSAQRDRIWLLMDGGPFLPWRIRPTERYMVESYYPIRELSTDDPTVRLLEFSTVIALPFEDTFIAASNLVFGESVSLASFILPKSLIYSSGEVLPITIFWQTTQQLEQNYNIALFLATDSGVMFVDNQAIQGWDTPPAAGFAPMPDWEVGEFIQDNRALRLPQNLPAGEYQIWIRLYTPESGGVDTLSVSGTGLIENDLAMLPVTISVR